MLTYVALGERTVDRIGQGMHADIGIGMPLKAPIMGNGDTAEHHVIAGAEPVDVIAVSDTKLHGLSKDARGALEIAGMGDLYIGLIAFDDCHVKPCGARHRHIIGSVAVMVAVRREDWTETKPLRCLRAEKSGAILRSGNQTAVTAPKRVGDGQSGRGTGRAFERRDHPADQAVAHTGARNVMDKHPRCRSAFESFKTVENRPRAGVTPRRDDKPRKAGGQGHVIRVQDKNNMIYIRMRREPCESVAGHALRADGLPLFWHRPTGPGAPASGHDEGGGCHAV